MNFRTTYALFATLVALLALAGLTLLTGGKTGDDALLLGSVKSAGLTAKDFTRLAVSRREPSEDKLVFTRDAAGKWKLSEPFEGRVESSAVERIVEDVLAARRDSEAGDVPRNLAQLALDPPAMTVTLSREAGGGKPAKAVSLALGNLTTGGFNALVYAAGSDRPRDPVGVKRSTLSSLFKGDTKDVATAGDLFKPASDFRSRDLLLEGVTFNVTDAVKSIKIIDGKNELVLTKQSSGWQYEKPANYGTADLRGDTNSYTEGQPPTGVEPLINSLTNIKPAATTDIIENVTDFAQYGLESGKEAAKFEVTRSGAAPVIETLLIGKKDGDTPKVFVRLAGEKSVAKVDEKLVEPLKKLAVQPGLLRDKTLLGFVPTTCDAVDVKLPGDDRPVEFRKFDGKWKLVEVEGSRRDINEAAVTELLSSLTGKVVKDFPEANLNDAQLGFDRPAAEIALYVNGILPDEKKDDAKDKDKTDKPARPKMAEPKARLIIGKRDKDLLYVRRTEGTSKADFALSEGLLAKLTRGKLDYLDATLPTFPVADVTKLEFTRDGSPVVIELVQKDDKTPGVWTLRQPADLADRAADTVKVQTMLTALFNLKSEKVYADRPTERDLERFGLKPAKTKIVVTHKDGAAAKDAVYELGNETDDKQFVYLKRSDRDAVYAVKPEVLASFTAADLQDPVVDRIDVSKVKSVKFTGWKDVLGAPATREFDRKSSTEWSVKSGDAFKVNANAGEMVLGALSPLRAEKFVARKSGPKPEHKLDPAAGALVLELTLEGEMTPVTLTIGGLDAEGRAYHATYSKVPGDVFTVAKEKFEAVKAKPGYFAAE